MKGLAADSGFLFDAAAKYFECSIDELAFSKDDVAIEHGKLGETNTLKIVFPMPDETLLCYRIYVLYDDAYQKIGCFGLAKGDARAQNRPILGIWRGGKFCVYAFCPIDDNEVIQRCYAYYVSPEFNKALEETKAKKMEE